MREDIEERLAAAAASLHGYELTMQRCAELTRRVDALSGHVSALRGELADEDADVRRLTGLSLTRVIASARGTRDDALARERAEAEMARYRLADAQARLDALCRERAAAQAAFAQLAGAPGAYAAALDEKERHLRESADPRAAQLLAFAEQRGQLTGELREIGEALHAAGAAVGALIQVRDKLGSAASWSTYDTFFGGGLISSSLKHGRLDDAARAAALADHHLAILRTELAQVPGTAVAVPQVAIDGLTRFIDVWFDNIFTDFAVRGRIKQAQQQVEWCIDFVHRVVGQLQTRATQAKARLAAIAVERRALLTRQR